MRGCDDKKYGKMLELYLMDLLNESEQEEFELHLLKCEKCSSVVENYNEISMLILNSPRARDLVSQAAAGGEPAGEAESLTETGRRGERQKWFPRAAIVFSIVAVVLLLILKPWHIEIGPDKTALAESNRLAVMPFENLTSGDNRPLLGRAASSLLITDLSEGRLIQVISDQHYQDIIRILGGKDEVTPDLELASQVAAKAGAKWLLMGKIRSLEPRMVLDMTLINAFSGDTLLKKEVSGGPGDEIFVVVDRLSQAIRETLTEFSADSAGSDRPVAEITTHSLPAYLNYIEGVDNYGKFYTAEAKRNFKEALKHDSTFAMAYYYLSLIDRHDMIDYAIKYQDRASRKERYYIRSQAALNRGDTTAFMRELKNLIGEYPSEKTAYYNLAVHLYKIGEYEEAKGYCAQALKLDSSYALVYNHLAYLYSRMGQADSALWAINRYIYISPREANPYDTRGDIYVGQGSPDLAIESYRMALEIRPDFIYTAVKLGNLYHLKRDYQKAEKYYTWRLEERSFIDSLNVNVELSNVLLSQGKVDSAIEFLDQSLQRFSENPPETNSYYSALETMHLRKAFALAEKDDSLALEAIDQIIVKNKHRQEQTNPQILQYYVQLLSRNGKYGKAKDILTHLKATGEEGGWLGLYHYWYADGCVQLGRGNFSQAVRSFKTATGISNTPRDFTGNFMLARAYIADDRFDEAISVLEQQINMSNFERLQFASWSAKIDYYLGIAYESIGDMDQAKKQFETFVEIWKNGDPDLPALIDAKSRLNRLTSVYKPNQLFVP